MNTRESIKTRSEAVEKRYGKKKAKVGVRTTGIKTKLKPKFGKKKIGLTYEVKF